MKRVFEEDINTWLKTSSFKIYFKSQDVYALLGTKEIIYMIRLWLLERSQDDAIRTIIGGIIFNKEETDALTSVQNLLENIKRRCVDYVFNTPIAETINFLKANPNDFFDWLISLNANFSPQFCGEDPIWFINESTITSILDLWISGKSTTEAISAYYKKTFPDYYSVYADTPEQVKYLNETLEEAKKWCVEAVIGLE